MRTDRRLLLRAGQQGQQQGHLFGHGGLRVGDQRGQAVVLQIGQEQIRFVFAHGGGVQHGQAIQGGHSDTHGFKRAVQIDAGHIQGK